LFASRIKRLGVLSSWAGQRAIQQFPALRGFAKWYEDGKVSGKPIEFAPSPVVEAMAAEVRRLNEFWEGIDLKGGVHRGFRRIFHVPDAVPLETFSWDMGDRLYSIGARSYQTDRKEDRARLTIDGEPVVELDVQASPVPASLSNAVAPLR